MIAEQLVKEAQTRNKPRKRYGHSLSTSTIALEVISGSNADEQLKLDDSPIVIGGSERCDLMLEDPSIEEECIVVERQGACALISPIAGAAIRARIHAPNSEEPITRPIELNPGNELSIGNNRFRVFDFAAEKNQGIPPAALEASSKSIAEDLVESSAIKEQTQALKTPPNAPKNQEHYLLWQQSIEQLDNKADEPEHNYFNDKFTDNFIDEFSEKTNDHVLDIDDISGAYAHSASHLDYEREERKKWWPFLVAAIVCCAFTVSVAQGFKSPDTEASQAIQPIADSKTNFSAPMQREPQRSPLMILQTSFATMLKARELPATIKLLENEGRYQVSGVLSEGKQAILSRMLARFRKKHDIRTPIENKVIAPEAALPFNIVQVTSGKYGNIVTDSGERLFLGDQLAGYQLVAIQDKQLVFAGKSRVTVAW